jgi:hypothetical protein
MQPFYTTPTLPNVTELLETNAQIRDKTLQRARALNVPLALDIVFEDDGYATYTSLNIPHVPRREWKNMIMEVSTRVQSVTILRQHRQFYTYKPAGNTMPFICPGKDHFPSVTVLEAQHTIRDAILGYRVQR